MRSMADYGRGPTGDGTGAWWLALPLLALCCGVPLLLSAGGVSAVLWAGGYGYAALGVVVVGLGVWGVWRMRRSAASKRSGGDCGDGHPPRPTPPL